MSKIKGGDLMLFVGGKSIAFATSHTLTISADTEDTSNKDEGGGDWQTNEVKTLSWTAKSENLYANEGNGETYDDLFDLMVAKTPVDAIFSKKTETVTDVPTDGWTPSVPKYTGKVIITSLELSAPNGSNASYTADFTGYGELKKVTTA